MYPKAIFSPFSFKVVILETKIYKISILYIQGAEKSTLNFCCFEKAY
jgi:hypothetical protein